MGSDKICVDVHLLFPHYTPLRLCALVFVVDKPLVHCLNVFSLFVSTEGKKPYFGSHRSCDTLSIPHVQTTSENSQTTKLVKPGIVGTVH